MHMSVEIRALALILSFYFPSQALARGVDVRLIMDFGNNAHHRMARQLAKLGMSVCLHVGISVYLSVRVCVRGVGRG